MGSTDGSPNPTVFRQGMVLNIAICLTVVFAATSAVVSGYIGDAQRLKSSRHSYQVDVQVLGNVWSRTEALTAQHLNIPFRRATGVAEVSEAEPGTQLSTETSEEPAEPQESESLLNQLQAYPRENAAAPKRVALLVFGLQRSLFLTLPSIKKRIIRPLTDVGYEPIIFVHQFDSVGTDKHSTGVTGEWWSMLRPFRYNVTSQETFLASHRSELDACLEQGTGWIFSSDKNQRATLNNHACQLQSVQEVTNMWEAHYLTNPEQYVAVAYMRPDVHFQSDFPVHLIPEMKENEVYVPNWANHMGMNDRFALLHPKTASVWKGRLDHALTHCLEEPVHSETFVRHFAASNSLQVVRLPVDFVFFRVRPDGSIPDTDVMLPGYAFAKRELKARQKAIAAHEVLLPQKNVKLTPRIWKKWKAPPQGAIKHKKQTESILPKSPAAAHEEVTLAQQQPPQREVDPESETWDNSVAVCAIMKQERLSDIREWLLYHKWLGVDKIYLRENKEGKPSQHIATAFQHLIDEGFLELGTWSGQSPEAQQLWYNRCSKGDLGGAQSWILFSDLDEYPVIMEGGVAVEEPDLKAFMKRQRGAAGLTLQWVMFGSGGHRDRPKPGGPLRHFDKCSDKLSFEMKCFAASHHLSKKPFIGPFIIHQCCYKYKDGDDPKHGPRVLYGDGSWKRNIKLGRMDQQTPEDAQNVPWKDAPKCRTYEGHLQSYEYKNATQAIPQGEALVLFHYMTRSFQDFKERKLSRYAGMYVDDFKERRANLTALHGTAPPDEELFDHFEHELGIDKEASVCSSAVEAQYASKCCE